MRHRPFSVLFFVLATGCAGPEGLEKASEALGMTARDAHLHAVQLQSRGEHGQSVPYFRHAVSREPSDWELHLDLAGALYNSSIETRLDFGMIEYRLPRSFDRVARVIEALHELEIADSLATDVRSTARIMATRDWMLGLWGLPSP